MLLCCAANDGIVFTPANATYLDLMDVNRSATPLLKWKFLDENTVDFRVKAEDVEDVSRPVKLYIWCKSVELEVATAQVTSELRSKLLDSMDDTSQSLVVECAFRPETGSWEIRRVRGRPCSLSLVSRCCTLTCVCVSWRCRSEETRTSPTSLAWDGRHWRSLRRTLLAVNWSHCSAADQVPLPVPLPVVAVAVVAVAVAVAVAVVAAVLVQLLVLVQLQAQAQAQAQAAVCEAMVVALAPVLVLAPVLALEVQVLLYPVRVLKHQQPAVVWAAASLLVTARLLAVSMVPFMVAVHLAVVATTSSAAWQWWFHFATSRSRIVARSWSASSSTCLRFCGRLVFGAFASTSSSRAT